MAGGDARNGDHAEDSHGRTCGRAKEAAKEEVVSSGSTAGPSRRPPTHALAHLQWQEPPRFILGWRIEMTLDMQIRAKLLQRSLGGGGNRGTPLVERPIPSFYCPRLSVVAVWWSLVRFRRAIRFSFFGQFLFPNL